MLQNETASRRTPWAKRALGAGAVLLLAAVPALGLAALGSESFALGQGGEPGPGAEVSNSPFPFDAPTADLRRARPEERRDGRTASRARSGSAKENAVVLRDWRFTQATNQQLATAFALQVSEDIVDLPGGNAQNMLLVGLLFQSIPTLSQQSYNNLLLANLGWFLFDVDDLPPFLANLDPLQRLILLEILFNAFQQKTASSPI